jgi:hypothetical protein
MSEKGQVHARPNELLIIAYYFRISLIHQRTIRSSQVQICLTWGVNWRAVTHLKSFEHVIAILLLTQPHDALFAILLDFSAQEPLELPAVAENEILAQSGNELLVHGFIAARRQAIVHINAQ